MHAGEQSRRDQSGGPRQGRPEADQRSGRLTEGVVRDILTKSGLHPHGIKVRLESGIVGRVKEILDG